MDHPRPPPRHHAGRGGLHASIPGGGGSDPDLRDGDSKAKSKGLKGGVEKMKRYLANLSFVEMSVVKATSAVDGPPKRKHVARLVEESWRDPQLAPVEAMNALGRCPMLNSPLISLKVLATAHELMQKGSPGTLPASFEWRDHFVMLDAHWTAAVADAGAKAAGHGLGRACAGLVVAYSRALLGKARFHDQCRGFENNYSFPGAADGGAARDERHEKKCAYDVKSLDAMLALGRATRETLDVVSAALPRNPPLAALQWHRLVAHVGVLVAVEAHLLHGATVYVAATVAAASPGGLDAERATPVSRPRRCAARSPRRARPAMKTAFMEEGAGGSFVPGAARVRPRLHHRRGADATASAGVVVRGAEQPPAAVGAARPGRCREPVRRRQLGRRAAPGQRAARGGDADDHLTAHRLRRRGGRLGAPRAAAPPPPPRPPLFGGYAQTPAQGSGPLASGAAPVGAHRPGFPSASGGGGAGAERVRKSLHGGVARVGAETERQPAQPLGLARETSVPAAGQLTSTRRSRRLSSRRRARLRARRGGWTAPRPCSRIWCPRASRASGWRPRRARCTRSAAEAESRERGGSGPGAGGFPSFATSQRVAYGAAPPPPRRRLGATALGAPAAPQYAPGHFNQTQGAFVPAQFGTPNAEQQQQQQQQQQQRAGCLATQKRQSPSPPPPGSPPPQTGRVRRRLGGGAEGAAAPFAPAPRPPP